MSTSKTDKPDLRVVRPASDELPVTVSALIPPEIESAVEALTRIQLGTGTLTDLAEIALTVNNGRTRFTRGWFLDAVTEALKDLQIRIGEAAYANRWSEATALKARQQELFEKLEKRLTRDLPKDSG